MIDLNVTGYSVLIELTADAETHNLLDYISYWNNIFKEKESTANASFITDNTFSVDGLKTKEEAHDIINILRNMELKDFNIPNIGTFAVVYYSCSVKEVINNE